MKQVFKSLVPVTFLCMPLIGCLSTPPKESTPEVIDQSAVVQPGETATLPPLEIANLALARAADQSSPQREASLLTAVDALLRANQVERAATTFAMIPPDGVPPGLNNDYSLSKAALYLGQRKPAVSLDELNNLQAGRLSVGQQQRLYRERANAYAMLGNHLEDARNRIQLASLLSDSEAQRDNEKAIWAALNMLNDKVLISLNLAGPPDVLSGWMQLAYLAKRANVQPELFESQLRAWRTNYPDHPASQELLASLLESVNTPLLHPGRIAVLLPQQGPFAKAAAAIRDGLLAAYYANNNPQRSPLYFYNVNAGNVVSVYQRAVAQGAEVIIGPLDKTNISTLINNTELSVPTLALNYIDGDVTKPNLFQYGLSPENEARQVAEHIWYDGYSRGLAIYPEGEWGARVYHAFLQRWTELGGEILESKTYKPEGTDFGTPVKTLLNVDESEQRLKSLERITRTDISFEARRRQDAEFVFMAGFARQARQLRPQLKFYNAGDLPVYATSHVYTGSINRNQDRDMDGIIFGDMPWTLNRQASLANSSLSTSIQQLSIDTRNGYTRLYAFAIDIYDLVPLLPKLAKYNYERFNGLTGTLRIDADHQVRRELSWARFSLGVPKTIDKIFYGPTQVLPARQEQISSTLSQ